jgi:hypothetical protein
MRNGQLFESGARLPHLDGLDWSTMTSDSAMVQHLFDSSDDEENIAPEKNEVAKTWTAAAKSKAVMRNTPSADDESAGAPLKSSIATSNKRKAKEMTIAERIKYILNRPDAYGTHFGFARSFACSYVLLTARLNVCFQSWFDKTSDGCDAHLG